MLDQNTYPDFFEEKEEIAQAPKASSKIDELLKYKSVLENHDLLKSNKNLIALATSCICSFLLLISGGQLINLNLWFIPLFFIFFGVFVTSTIFTYLLKINRNIIWIHLLGILVPYLLIAIFTRSLLTGSTWLAMILIGFLLFIAFLETENALALNRLFMFNSVIYQPKKLIILTACILTTFGAFMSINSSGGAQYIENTVSSPLLYNVLFNPNSKTAVLGKAVINQRIQTSISQANAVGKPLTYQDFLNIKLDDSTKAKSSFYETFAQQTYCKESAAQTDDTCKTKLEEYSKLAFANKSKEEYGVDVASPSSTVKLDSPINDATMKFIIKKSYANSLSSFINSTSSATNPLKIYSILGKSEGVSLFISTVLFVILLLSFVFLNLVSTLFSWLTFRYLKKNNIISITTAKEEIEQLAF
jgi:hypothetical protein